MKTYIINSATTFCVCVFLSGCFGTTPIKPIVVGESKEGVVVKVDENGRFTLVNDQGVPYIPCGEGQPIQCPPISKTNPRKLIGTISEIKTSQPTAEANQPALMTRSYNRSSSCEYVIEYEIEGKIIYFIASLCVDGENR